MRVQVQFVYHHRETGGNLSGSKRLVFTVKNDLIVRVEEFHDAAMVEAFMRLTAHRALTMDAPSPPERPEHGQGRTRPRRVLWSR